MRGAALWLLAGVWLAGRAVMAADFYAAPSVSDFGGVGLWQTPTARFAEDGEMVVSGSSVSPYNRYAFTIQALPWLEGVIRYTEISNRLYGPESFSGDQTYKDRGFDLKLRLLEEGAYVPQVALGMRDIGGTSLFSSEYVVASKRWYDWDFTLGVAWGYLGNGGGIPNPLGFLADYFDQPRPESNAAGNFGLSQLFRGPEVGLFGGIEYRPPIEGLSLKVEYDGNDYQHEPFDNSQPQDLPVNLGLVYRPFDWLDLSLGLERGNTAMFQVALRANLNRDKGPPKRDPPPTALKPQPWKPQNLPVGPMPVPGGAGGLAAPGERSGKPGQEDARRATAVRITEQLQRQGFWVSAVDLTDTEVTAYVAQDTYRAVPKAIGRAARVMASLAPPEVVALTVANLQAGVETTRVTLMRDTLEQAANHQASAEELWADAAIGVGLPDYAEATLVNPDRYPAFDWSLTPALRQHIGGPDAFYFWQLWGRLAGELEVARGASVGGALGFNLANNLGGLKLESNSVLPHVRSDVKKYLQGSDVWLSRLEADYLWQLTPAWYARVSAGLLEEMFGGVAGEVLYRPYESRLALGMDLAWARQRDYDMLFEFLDYDVVTGHATLYWDTPYHGVVAAVSAGRYLAGDYGVTLDISRRFDNGTVFGAFATFTDVSAEEFGEGSFDKGFYISVPMDVFLTRSSRSHAGFVWRPLTRDGGQRLAVGKRLYSVVDDASPGALARDWPHVLN